MHIEIIGLNEKDLECLAKLHVEVWNQTYASMMTPEMQKQNQYASRLQFWKKTLKDKDPKKIFRLAKFKGQIAGFIAAGLLPRDDLGFDAELYAINILEAYHKLGIGKKLMEAAFAFCRSHGAKNIYLWVAARNVNAVDFYTKLGGKRETFTKVNRGLDHICFSWNF